MSSTSEAGAAGLPMNSGTSLGSDLVSQGGSNPSSGNLKKPSGRREAGVPDDDDQNQYSYYEEEFEDEEVDGRKAEADKAGVLVAVQDDASFEMEELPVVHPPYLPQRQEESKSSEALDEAQKLERNWRYTLVLDLDETLIHYFDRPYEGHSGRAHTDSKTLRKAPESARQRDAESNKDEVRMGDSTGRSNKSRFSSVSLPQAHPHLVEDEYGTGYFLIRPGAREFLKSMSSSYELIIFTAAM